LKEQDAVPGFDIWSFGIIVYQLMMGTLPYKASKYEMIKAIEET
jgi:hypothetical protein